MSSLQSSTTNGHTRLSINKPPASVISRVGAKCQPGCRPSYTPDRFEVRYVSANGGIRWNKDWVNVSTVCIGEYVGLEEIDNGVWKV